MRLPVVRWAGRRGLAGRVEEAGDGGATLPVVEVVDLQLDLTSGWPEAVLGHGHGCALADDVPTEPEPADTLQLQAHAGRLGQGAMKRRGEIERLEDEELDADASSVSRQPSQERLVGERQARRQVEHEEVDGTAGDERAGQAQPLPRLGRSEDDEPAQVHPASGSLEWIEGPAAVQPGHDAASGLCLGDGAQRQRRLAR